MRHLQVNVYRVGWKHSDLFVRPLRIPFSQVTTGEDEREPLGFVVVRDGGRIGDLNNILFNCWFEAQGVDFTSDENLVVISFNRENSDNMSRTPLGLLLEEAVIPVDECVLEIHKAETCRVEESDIAAWDELARVSYEEDRRVVRIVGAMGLTAHIQVHSLDLAARETGKLVGEVRKKRIRFPLNRR